MSNRILGNWLVKSIATLILWIYLVILILGLIGNGLCYLLGFKSMSLISTLYFAKTTLYYLMLGVSFLGGIQIMYLLLRNRRKLIELIKHLPSMASTGDGENDV
jgi:hypothetical protein